MRFLEGKNIFKKLLISIALVIMLMFVFSNKSEAGDVGGIILDPVMSFFVGIGDGIISITQNAILGTSGAAVIQIDASSNIPLALSLIVGGVILVGGIILAASGVGLFSMAMLSATKIVIQTAVGAGIITFLVSGYVAGIVLPEDYVLPEIALSPYEIFSGQIPALDVNFVNPKISELTDEQIQRSTAAQLAPTVATWYKNLRNIAVIASLSILVYIGIRIVLSSTARDQSKYKQMLSDWVIALCLIFIMHYIMAATNLFVNEITQVFDGVKVVSNGNADTDLDERIGQLENEGNQEEAEKLSELKNTELYAQTGIQLFAIKEKKQVKKAYEVLVEKAEPENVEKYKGLFSLSPTGDPETFYWPTRNFTEQARMMLQYEDEGEDVINSQVYISLGWKLIYCMLVIYTVIFLFTYVKRVIYMAFLTIIAPLVAMTYPLDKIKDGSAQAFNYWFKEYIYNLLLQIIHLLLYTILIGSAMQFAAQNIIYVVVALGFMVPAEKLIRSMFGFKGETPGFFSGAAGAGIMMGLTQRLLGRKPPEPMEAIKKEKPNFFREKESIPNDGYMQFDNSEVETVASGDNTIPETDSFEDTTDQQENSVNGNESGNVTVNGSETQTETENIDGNENGYVTGNGSETENETVSESGNGNRNVNGNGNVNGNVNVNGNGNGNGNGTTAVNANATYSRSFKPQTNIERPSRSKEIRKPNKGIISGFKRMAGTYLNDQRNRLKENAKKGKPVSSMLKTASGIGMGVLGGTAGAMAAIAGGKADIKNIGIGAVAGYKAGSGISSSTTNNIQIEGLGESFMRGLKGDEKYLQDKMDEYFKKKKKELERDSDFRNAMIKELGNEDEFKNAMNTIGMEAIKKGFTEAKEIATLYKRSIGMGSDGKIDETLLVKNENGEVDHKKTLYHAMQDLKVVKSAGKDINDFNAPERENFEKTIQEMWLKNNNELDKYKKYVEDAKNIAISPKERNIADKKRKNIEEKYKPYIERTIGRLESTSKIFYKK